MAHHAIREIVRPSPVAMSYAQALLDLANDNGHAEEIGREIEALQSILAANPTSREILVNPAIGIEEREQMIDRIFRNNVSPLLFNTLGIMNEHMRLGIFPEVAAAYAELLDKQLGKVEVDLSVAHKLSPEQLAQATQKISAALGRQAVLHVYVDEAIIGGMVIRIGDELIDSSVKYQLEAMKEKLLSAGQK